MKPRRILRDFAMIFIITLIALEAALQLTDPWGLKPPPEGLLQLQYVENERGFSLPPGEYTRQYGSITILPDLTRAVPASYISGSRWLFFGDSVTFGTGVDDSKTFVNLLAERLNGQVLNTAFAGHNITYIQRAFEIYAEPQATLVWLIIRNDIDQEYNFPEDLINVPGVFGYQLLLLRYWLFKSAVAGQPRDSENFYRLMDAITGEYDNLILFAFDDDFGRELAARYPVNLIAWYTSHISVVNLHPDAAGHIEIADSMEAIIAALL